MNRVLTGRFGRLWLVAIAGCAAASFCGTAPATTLWYDGFTTTDAGGDYVIGSSGTPDLAGQSGGSGVFSAARGWRPGIQHPRQTT